MSLAPAAPVKSLYIHVPFCARKCQYCAFFSEPAGSETVNRYVQALIEELEIVAPGLQPCTVYFGGGTPSLLNLRQWRSLLSALERLRLLGADEWTIECNPATVSADKARLWRDYGVNRLSLGVQSLDPALLERLGRIHTRERFFKTFDLLRRSSFDNLNIDLMFAIPGQTMASWRGTLAEALALGSEHLSTYEVIYEEDTPLFEQLQASQFSVDEDLACAMYEELVDRAAAQGLEQYEIANFAQHEAEAKGMTNDRGPMTNETPMTRHKGILPHSTASGVGSLDIGHSLVIGHWTLGSPVPRFACRHNVNYWRGGSYYGLGPSATSYVDGVRMKNWSNTILYCEQLERGKRAIESRDELPPLQRAGEIAAFGLRMNAGWPFEQFRQVTGFDLCREWQTEMAQLVEQGLGVIESDGFRLTRRGLRFADTAAELFLR